MYLSRIKFLFTTTKNIIINRQEKGTGFEVLCSWWKFIGTENLKSSRQIRFYLHGGYKFESSSLDGLHGGELVV